MPPTVFRYDGRPSRGPRPFPHQNFLFLIIVIISNNQKNGDKSGSVQNVFEWNDWREKAESPSCFLPVLCDLLSLVVFSSMDQRGRSLLLLILRACVCFDPRFWLDLRLCKEKKLTPQMKKKKYCLVLRREKHNKKSKFWRMMVYESFRLLFTSNGIARRFARSSVRFHPFKEPLLFSSSRSICRGAVARFWSCARAVGIWKKTCCLQRNKVNWQYFLLGETYLFHGLEWRKKRFSSEGFFPFNYSKVSIWLLSIFLSLFLFHYK